RIEVKIVGRNVVCEQDKSLDKELMAEDERFRKQRMDRALKAKGNSERLKDGKPIVAGEFVQKRLLPEEDHAHHQTIHLFTGPKDEIEWFSREEIDFTVHIQRNPELVRVLANTLTLTAVPSGKDDGIDNLFQKAFPLKSTKGAAVCSGPIKGEKEDT